MIPVRRLVPVRRQVLLAEWFVKLVRPGKEQPPNVVTLAVPQQMTKLDVKNYLAAIYGVQVEKVATLNVLGKTKRHAQTGRLYNRPDFKKAYVYLQNETFTFPDLNWQPKKAPEAPASAASSKEQEQQALEQRMQPQGFE